MSEQPENDGRGAPGPTDRVHAGVRHGWWPGWIWAIPIAALLVVIWLGARTLLAGGTDITIRLTDAHNLKKENTDVVLRGTQVGHVTGIELTPDGTAVIVSASIDKDAAKFLTTGTRFWLQGANPSLGNLSSLGSLLSGPTIIMDPGPGRKARHFLGLERAPIDPSVTEQPLLYEISVDSDAGALAGGDPVTLRGFTVARCGMWASPTTRRRASWRRRPPWRSIHRSSMSRVNAPRQPRRKSPARSSVSCTWACARGSPATRRWSAATR